jgi:hypothetical protein
LRGYAWPVAFTLRGRRPWIAAALVLLAAPGWRGELVPVAHDEVLAVTGARAAGEVFGVARAGERQGEEWHAQYVASPPAEALFALGLRKLAPALVAPQFVAHVPPGFDGVPQRADGYYRVATSWRWPWWWPGGGVDWRLP